MTNEFDDMSPDEIANGLVSGNLKTSCPMTQKMVDDVNSGNMPIDKLKEEIAKTKLSKIA